MPSDAPPHHMKLYRIRWYILFLASMVSFWQCFFWLCFSPIVPQASEFFQISVSMINLLLNWGGIVYVIMTIPFVILLNIFKDTLRVLMVTASFLVALGMGIRCFVLMVHDGLPTVAILNTAMVLNAIASPLVMIFPPFLSAVWFPDNERTKATAISALANSLGPGFAFLLSPLVVDKLGMKYFIIGEACIAAFFFILVLIYFPAKPPRPPSQSAMTGSTLSLSQEFGIIASTPSFIFLVVAGGFEQGALFGWSGLFNQILVDEFDNQVIGLIGFGCITGGCIFGVFIGILGDSIFKRRFKLLLALCWSSGFILSIIYMLSLPSIFSDKPIFEISKTGVMIIVISSGSLLFGTSAIVLELAVELTYPVSEGTTAGIVTWLLNGSMMLFLFVVPDFNKDYANAFFSGTILFSLLLLMLVKEKYLRLDIDEGITKKNKYDPIQDHQPIF